MKKLLLTLLLSAGAGCVYAEDGYGYLVFAQNDGTESSLATGSLTITFPDGKIVATDGTSTFTAPLADMARMYFSSTPTGIASVSGGEGGAVSAEISGGRLRVTAPAGSTVRLYRADGSSVPADAQLEPGVYLVNINGRTLKTLAK